MPKIVSHDERRRDIARAAWRVIAKSGLEGLTTRAVAREAGWSTGVLSHYFENRNDLVLAAFSLVADDVEARVNARLECEQDPRERVWIAVSEGATLDETRLTEARVWFTFIGLAAGISPLRKEVEDRYAIWYRLVEPELVRAGVPRRNASLIARRMIAVVDGFAVQAMFDRDAIPAQQMETEVRMFVERCIEDARRPRQKKRP
jgi:AcrR family transcriptional regulator